MKATKGRGDRAAGNPLPTLKALLKRPGAREALDRLGPKVDKERLVRFLRWVVINWILRKSSRSHWAILTGMEKHTLRRLPFSVRVFASKIEHANSHPLLNLGRIAATQKSILVLTDAQRAAWSLAEPRCIEFDKLPSLLRAYADVLEVLLRAAGEAIVKNPRMLDSRKMVECALMEYVKGCTGKSHLPQIATLLNAACWESGVLEASYAPSALDAARKRTPKTLSPFVRALAEC